MGGAVVFHLDAKACNSTPPDSILDAFKDVGYAYIVSDQKITTRHFTVTNKSTQPFTVANGFIDASEDYFIGSTSIASYPKVIAPNDTFGITITYKADSANRMHVGDYELIGTPYSGHLNIAAIWRTTSSVESPQNRLATFSVYPNPSPGEFTFVAEPTTKFEVYDLLGNLITKLSTLSGKAHWRNSVQGTYFVRAIEGEVVSTKRLVVY